VPTYDICGDWEDLDPDERAEAFEEALNALLVDLGYDHVDVEVVASGGARTNAEGDILMGREFMDDLDRNDGVETLFHEAWHAMDIQDGTMDEVLMDATEFNMPESFFPYWDEDDQLRAEILYDDPAHDDAQAFGRHMGDTYCDGGGDAGRASPAPAPADVYGAGPPPAAGLDFEFDMGPATVEAAPPEPDVVAEPIEIDLGG
jgi:hypothetical protein